MSAPGKLVRSSRWKSGPSKGQRPLGSECCVAAGDSGLRSVHSDCMGCGIEPRKIRHRRGRGFSLARRQHVAPLCEVLLPCRGLRPHHVQRDRIGTWEVSCLTVVVKC
jgi:hypothetical protein